MLTMKRMKLELARVGIFGQDGATVTKGALREVAETFAGRAPIVIGHNLADFMPAFGYVVGVDFDEEAETLSGDVELTDVMADAYDTGYYRNWSIGIRRRAEDGKAYIHHLAMLGQAPPKIKDLNVIAASEAVNLSEVAEHWTTERPEDEGGGDADPPEAADTPARLSDEHAGPTAQEAADQLKEHEMSDSEKLKATEQKLSEAVGRIRASAKQNLMQAVEGRLPKEKHGLVLELADRLPVDDRIELADGGEKRTVSTMDLLSEIFSAIPAPVRQGEAELSDEETRKQTDYSGLAKQM